MHDAPSSPVTILFTDIEASTSLWDHHEPAMRLAHASHNELLSGAFEEHGGTIVKDKGDGFMVIFANPVSAVTAAVEGQRRLAGAEWPEETGDIKVRMALNTGVVEPRDGDYYGPEVNRAARIESLAHGGQILISETTRSLAASHLDAGIDLIDLGLQRLRGLSTTERIYQVAAPGLGKDFPNLNTAPRGAGLPQTATTFVGRTEELADIVGLVDSGSRLVTLLGPGGIGKTRLAIESAREIEDRMAGGAHFADLTQLGSHGQVGQSIAEALGVHAEGNAEVSSLVSEVVNEPTLLVVDNMEHVIEAAATVGRMLDQTPNLNLIATSRQPLGLQGEHLYRLQPLATTANGKRNSAVELFYDRAAAQGAILTDADRSAVESIAKRLDGLPLAIELVAPRARLLAAAEIDGMLADSLDPLSSSEADRPERHRTIRNAIDWSLSALDDEARTLFARLSTLPAGATLAMTEVVCCPDLSGSALDHLATLVDNSLVNPTTGLPGGTRYGQLVPLREYGLEILKTSGDYEQTMNRLIDYYVANAPSVGDRMLTSSETDAEVAADHANLVAALQWSLRGGRGHDMAQVAFAMWIYWFNGDRIAPLVAWSEEASQSVSSPELDWILGFLAFQAGDMEKVAIQMPVALEGFTRDGNVRGRICALMFGSITEQDPDRAYAMLDEAYEAFPDEITIGRYLILLFQSIVDFQTGELESSLRRREEGLASILGMGLPELEAWMSWNVALAYYGMGQHDEATAALRKTYDYMAAELYQEGTASAAEVIALLEIGAGRPERAMHLIGASGSVFARIGTSSWFEARHHVEVGVERLRDEVGDAKVDEWINHGRTLSFPELVEMGFRALEQLEVR